MLYKPVVLNIVCGHRGIGDPVVNDGVHAHRHRVPRENLEGRVFMSLAFKWGGGEHESKQDEGT